MSSVVSSGYKLGNRDSDYKKSSFMAYRGANWWLLDVPPILFSSKFYTNFSKWSHVLELVQNYFEKLVQNFELKRVEGVPKDH